MTAGSVLFLLASLACVVGAVATIVARNPVRSAMGLLTTIVGIAALFLKLNAEFLAAIQLIVYAGAVVVLFVFVLMLLGADAAPVREDRGRVEKAIAGGLLGLMALGTLVVLAPKAGEATPFPLVSPDHGSVEAVGKQIFGPGVVPFELATALLIVAVVGAIAVARGRPFVAKRAEPVTKPTEFFTGPVDPRDDAGKPKEATP
jgi:NADH-quinone oxidoreductase subunit J